MCGRFGCAVEIWFERTTRIDGDPDWATARPASARVAASAATLTQRDARPEMLDRRMRIASLTEADAEQHRSSTGRRTGLELSNLLVREIFDVQEQIRAVRERVGEGQAKLGERIEIDLVVPQRALMAL